MKNSVSRAAAESAALARARELGAGHAGTGRQAWDLDRESELLMDALGEAGPTTDRNRDRRERLCEFYDLGYATARRAARS